MQYAPLCRCGCFRGLYQVQSEAIYLMGLLMHDTADVERKEHQRGHVRSILFMRCFRLAATRLVGKPLNRQGVAALLPDSVELIANRVFKQQT